MHDIDIHIVGWPWALDNFAWVEPTAWACLALRRAGFGSDPRVDEGLRLLLDRATDAGGINYGNRHVFGRLTEPLPGPTALMLLALQGHGDHPRVQAAIRYLQREIETDDDLEHLCWTKLALDALASPIVSAPGALANLDDRIIAAHKARTGATWLRSSCLRDALTALALATEQRNVFRLEHDEAASKERRSKIEGRGSKAILSASSNPQSSIRKTWTHRLKSFVRGFGIE